MNLRFTNRVALVTGGASGIGKLTCQRFAEEGANVVIADIQDELGEQVALGIRDRGGDATYVRLDVTSEEDWAAAVAKTVEKYGRLDILVNNAGIGDTEPLEEVSYDTPILGDSDKSGLIAATPMGRLRRPDDIATVIRFLLIHRSDAPQVREGKGAHGRPRRAGLRGRHVRNRSGEAVPREAPGRGSRAIRERTRRPGEGAVRGGARSPAAGQSTAEELLRTPPPTAVERHTGRRIRPRRQRRLQGYLPVDHQLRDR